MADKMISKSDLNWSMIFSSMLGMMFGISMGRCAAEHYNDESGTVLTKANTEITVDLDGDGKADRVIRFCHSNADNMAYYDYVRPGDKILYNNSNRADTLYGVAFGYNELRKVNDVKAENIRKYYRRPDNAR